MEEQDLKARIQKLDNIDRRLLQQNILLLTLLQENMKIEAEVEAIYADLTEKTELKK